MIHCTSIFAEAALNESAIKKQPNETLKFKVGLLTLRHLNFTEFACDHRPMLLL